MAHEGLVDKRAYLNTFGCLLQDSSLIDDIDRPLDRIPPTIEEVRAYCLKRENRVNPEQFIDYYESKGWFIGKSKMKDWKAAVRTWERRNHGQSSKGNTDKFTDKKFGDYL